MYIHTPTYIYTYMQTYTCIHMCKHTRVFMFICIHIYTCVRIHIYVMYTHWHVCTCVYILHAARYKLIHTVASSAPQTILRSIFLFCLINKPTWTCWVPFCRIIVGNRFILWFVFIPMYTCVFVCVHLCPCVWLNLSPHHFVSLYRNNF